MHEQTSDLKVIHAILSASHHIHFLSQAKRKQYLYTFLGEHGIWHAGDSQALWKDLIEETVALKVQEAARRKARKEALAAAAG